VASGRALVIVSIPTHHVLGLLLARAIRRAPVPEHEPDLRYS
jgi:hypothetical protein